SESTYFEYKKGFSEFSESLKETKEYVDGLVENALLKRALGYAYDETTRENREGKLVTTKIVTKQVIPDVTAQIYWLKNRRADKWREKIEKCEQENTDKFPPVSIPANLMCGKYFDINRRITNGDVREAIIKGGRGGWKSTYPGLKIPELMMANPQVHCLAVRNVKDTLKDSVYAQIKWGIEMLGVSDRFKCTVSPLAITYLPTGQQIYFRGADDPLKIKSIKPSFGYIGILWFEEFDQYSGEAAIRNIKQSALRGTDSNGESSAIIFETYNPPKTAQAWANQYTADIEARQNTANAKKGTHVLHTTYKDLPREWLGDEFLFEAEELKKNNPTAYDNEYLGIVTGTGGNVFENLEIRTITDAEIQTFGQYKQGLDWGYFPDPTAFLRGYYNPATMTIYLFDERKYIKTGNEALVDNLAGYKDTQTIADNAEEKSIAYFKEKGFKIRACVKGAGSVEFGIKWLASRAKIVIDRSRCPEAAKEFENYEYLKDKDGNYISGYPDENNHFIDATRYMLIDEIMRSKQYKTYGGISRV
ncbi:MAG: PBSX family phage terminase large subunit, partial [Clostridia bacterium]|nr:PBSX family phage terminase large subunit [Clostridia bacterium]